MLCDFHVHSTWSDGTFTPRELAEEAHRVGVGCFALTDHDDLAGIAEAASRGAELGVDVRLGVESSVNEEVPGAGENVKVEFTEFEVNDVAIELVKDGPDGDIVTLPFDSVVYYLANLQVEEVSDLVQIDWPVPGQDLAPSTPRVPLRSPHARAPIAFVPSALGP